MKKCQSKCLLKSLLMPLDDESKDLLAHTETKITEKNEERSVPKTDQQTFLRNGECICELLDFVF